VRVHATINRFADTPDDIGIPKASYVHHWHLHRPGEAVDAEIAEPDRWGKGPYPVNFDGLAKRTWPAEDAEYREQPTVLEMEVGQQVFDYRDTRDRLALEHVGKVVGALGGVDCVYGHGWSNEDPCCFQGDTPVCYDLASYCLIGCPDRLAISAYGEWDHHWAPNLKPKIDRAKRLADAIKWKPVCPVLFISPFVAREGDMPLDEWRMLCVAAHEVAGQTGSDLMIWWDGGPKRRPYLAIEDYIDTAREVLL
jgi:hypothetical protein